MSQTDRGQLAYEEQVDCSQLPTSPVWQIINAVSASLAYSKQTVESGVLDALAQPTDTVKVGASSAGTISIEWAAAAFNEFLEAAVRGTYDSVIAHTGTATIAATAATLTATGAFANASVGQFVLLTGFIAGESYAGAGDSTNNGWYEIAAVTSDDEVVLANPRTRLKDEVGGVGCALTSKRLLNGVEERCYAIEEGLLDVGSWFAFLGQVVNGFSMSLTAGQIATGDFAFMGSNVLEDQVAVDAAPSWGATASYTPALQNPSMNATNNVGDILVDGDVSTSCFRTLTLTQTNNLRETACIGKEFPRIDYGSPAMTGSFEKIFTDTTLWRKMRDHEPVSLEVALVSQDKTGGIHISLPKVNLNSDPVDLSGGRNSDVYDKVDFSASKFTNDADETYYVQICVA